MVLLSFQRDLADLYYNYWCQQIWIVGNITWAFNEIFCNGGKVVPVLSDGILSLEWWTSWIMILAYLPILVLMLVLTPDASSSSHMMERAEGGDVYVSTGHRSANKYSVVADSDTGTAGTASSNPSFYTVHLELASLSTISPKHRPIDSLISSCSNASYGSTHQQV